MKPLCSFRVAHACFIHVMCVMGFLCLLLPMALWADGGMIQLPSIFTDHMVLQRDAVVPVWGVAEPAALVTVAFNGNVKKTTAGSDGAWRVDLDPQPFSMESRLLMVQADYQGRVSRKKFSDVLVGDVWLCSGQSNMEWVMGKVAHYPGVEGGEEACRRPEQPELRLFSDNALPIWKGRGWRRCVGDDLRAFSAIAYFFGDTLQRELRIPIGLVNISRGGSPIQQWIPESFARQHPVIQHYSNVFLDNRKQIESYNTAVHRVNEARHAGYADVPLPAPLPTEQDRSRGFYGHGLFNDLIEPLIPFAVRGVLWYQGESNTESEDIAGSYDGMLKLLIEGWRTSWGQAAMPWFIVQLPCWDSSESQYWPLLRESQLKASQTIPYTFLSVSVDLCDPRDIHPPQKQGVGKRLAQLALVHTYEKDRICRGPVVTSITSEEGALWLQFDDGGAPIVLAEGGWQDVEVAGKDGRFYPAQAVVRGNTAVVTSPRVSAPSTVRYGWKPVFTPTLFNEAGFPASPFLEPVAPHVLPSRQSDGDSITRSKRSRAI